MCFVYLNATDANPGDRETNKPTDRQTNQQTDAYTNSEETFVTYCYANVEDT